MAAEVLAQGGAARHRLRRDAVGGPQIPDGGARRAQSDAQRTAAGISRALSARRCRSSHPRSRPFRRTPCAQWSEALGQPTFVGSSGRVFPEGVQGLAVAARLAAAAGCAWACNSRFGIAGPAGTSEAVCCFETPDGQRAVEARATVLALGGASWPRLGSDGAWAETLAAKGVAISPLRPANCGFTVAWSDIFRDRFEGQPLKGVALSFGAQHRARRSHDHAHGHRRRRDLCAVGRIARGHRQVRAGDAARRLAARSRNRATWSRGCRRREASNRFRTCCARPRIFRLSPSDCCRRRRWRRARRCRRCRRRDLAD